MLGNRFLVAIGGIILFTSSTVYAGDIKIPLPHRAKFTPVQKLNREGVEAIHAHRYEKAKALFYEAYLYDPDDPFTLNNLGYVSELEGKLDNAQRFYALALQRATDAVVETASAPQMKGKAIKDAITNNEDATMRISRDNVEAIRLLSKQRAFEADHLLQETLSLNPRNAFTLNNIGVAKEMQGELEEALKYYDAAAGTSSMDEIVVTLSRNWLGKPVPRLAAENASRVRELLRTEDNPQVKAARLNLRGVLAVNHNDPARARQLFQSAFAIDPRGAFSLNNMGYLAEMDGDLETAQGFYDEARSAQNSKARVGVATESLAEGKKLFEVAEDSSGEMTVKLSVEREIRRRENRPIELRRREKKPQGGAEQSTPQSPN